MVKRQSLDSAPRSGRAAAHGQRVVSFGGMPSLLLDVPPGLYRGRAEGPESGRCEARLLVNRIPGRCVSVDYEAVGAEGTQHVEHTVVASGFLYVAHSEADGVAVFTERAPGVFDGAPGGPYLQRLVVGWGNSELTWAWHWALAGEELREQSRAVVRMAEY